MMRWRPTQWDDLVEGICMSWYGTPYRLNGSLKGLGVDCLHFAASVLDELYGTSQHSQDLASLPPDACIHNKQGVMVAARGLFTAYPNIERVRDQSIEAGDLILLGRDSDISSTQHLLVAGYGGKLWNADSGGVTYTGFSGFPHLKYVCSYRASDKDKWLPC